MISPFKQITFVSEVVILSGDVFNNSFLKDTPLMKKNKNQILSWNCQNSESYNTTGSVATQKYLLIKNQML